MKKIKNDTKFVMRDSFFTQITANPDCLPESPGIFQKRTHDCSKPLPQGLLSELQHFHNEEQMEPVRFSNIFLSSGDLNSKVSQINDASSNLNKFHINIEDVVEVTNNVGNSPRTGEISKCNGTKRKHINSLEKNNISPDAHIIDVDESVNKKKQKLNFDGSLDTEILCSLDVGKQTNKHVQYYKVKDEKKYLFHIQENGSFVFKGKIRITLVYGEAEIFGFTFNKKSTAKSLDLYSPKHCMVLSITSKPCTMNQDGSTLHELIENDISLIEIDKQNLLNTIQQNDTLLFVEDLSEKCINVLTNYFLKDLFYEETIFRETSDIMRELNCYFDFSKSSSRKAFTKGDGWDEVPLKNCTVVCGGKGVGKSTFLKYLVNRTLSNRNEILYLDLDPGQTEFTAPGCVSAVIVRKPLLGPSFTHVTNPTKMVCLGEVNIGMNPKSYVKAVDFLIKNCKSEPELKKLPWFVNTMGFNKGLGVDIMVNVMKLLKPDLAVQIHSSDPSKNYPFELSVEKLKAEVATFVSCDDVDLCHNLVVMNSCAKLRGIGFQSGFKPVELRDLMMLAYLSQIVMPPHFNFNAVQPSWKSFSNLYLGLSSIISPNDVLKAFNGSLVSLTAIQEKDCEQIVEAEGQETDYFKIAIKPPITESFGLDLLSILVIQQPLTKPTVEKLAKRLVSTMNQRGVSRKCIVRGIDCKERKIFILTYLTEKQLEKVNCLVLGKVNLPSSIFFKQFKMDRPTVYTNYNSSRNVQYLKRSFRPIL